MVGSRCREHSPWLPVSLDLAFFLILSFPSLPAGDRDGNST